MKTFYWVFVLSTLFSVITCSVPLKNLFNFGPDLDTQLVGEGDDFPSPPVLLPSNFWYYNNNFSNVRVGVNGDIILAGNHFASPLTWCLSKVSHLKNQSSQLQPYEK